MLYYILDMIKAVQSYMVHLVGCLGPGSMWVKLKFLLTITTTLHAEEYNYRGHLRRVCYAPDLLVQKK